jgi:hypothetical protein
MKPRRLSRRPLPLTTQLSLPFQATRVAPLDEQARAGLIAVLAGLLSEAVRPPRDAEGADDAS